MRLLSIFFFLFAATNLFAQSKSAKLPKAQTWVSTGLDRAGMSSNEIIESGEKNYKIKTTKLFWEDFFKAADRIIQEHRLKDYLPMEREAANKNLQISIKNTAARYEKKAYEIILKMSENDMLFFLTYGEDQIDLEEVKEFLDCAETKAGKKMDCYTQAEDYEYAFKHVIYEAQYVELYNSIKDHVEADIRDEYIQQVDKILDQSKQVIEQEKVYILMEN